MWKKTLTIAAVAGGLAVAPMMAEARDDRAAGAVAGGLIGALIGSSVSGSDGAAVGGILGAFAGAAIANDRDHRHYRGHRDYRGYDRAYYGQRNGYQGPAYYGNGNRYPNGYTRAYNGGYRDDGYRGDWRRY